MSNPDLEGTKKDLIEYENGDAKDKAIEKYGREEYLIRLKIMRNLRSYYGKFSLNIEKYVELAAKKGDSEAQFCLADVYLEGIGRDKSYKEAFAWAYVAHILVSPRGDQVLEYASTHLTPTERIDALGLGEQYLRAYTNVLNEPSKVIIR